MSEGSSGPAWGRVYQDIVRDPSLSLGAKGLYAYFCSFSDERGKCFPPIETIRLEIPLANKTYYRYLKELRDAGIITIEKVKHGNRYGSNVYYLHIPQYTPSQFPKCTMSKKETMASVTKETPAQCKKATTKQTISTSHNKQTNNNMIDNADSEQRAAIDKVCRILNSRRGKRNLKASVGLWMLDKPPGGTWADLIPLASAFVSQYHRPDDSEDNNHTITWGDFRKYLRQEAKKHELQ